MTTDYDQYQYTSRPFDNTAPANLSGLAGLFGLETADVSTARVLELGCGVGLPGVFCALRGCAVTLTDRDEVRAAGARHRVAAPPPACICLPGTCSMAAARMPPR